MIQKVRTTLFYIYPHIYISSTLLYVDPSFHLLPFSSFLTYVSFIQCWAVNNEFFQLFVCLKMSVSFFCLHFVGGRKVFFFHNPTASATSPLWLHLLPFSLILSPVTLASPLFFKRKVKVLVTWSCRTLCDPVDCNPPGFSVHRILQARMLEWVTISFSRGIFPTQGSDPGIEPQSPALRADALASEPSGKPLQQSKSPLTARWIKKWKFIHKMVWMTKVNELQLQATVITFTNVMMNERNQTQKMHISWFHLYQV